MRIKFKPKKQIRRVVDGKSFLAFTPKGEYEGEIFGDGTIMGDSNKCDKPIKIQLKDVNITMRLK